MSKLVDILQILQFFFKKCVKSHRNAVSSMLVSLASSPFWVKWMLRFTEDAGEQSGVSLSTGLNEVLPDNLIK